MDVWDRFPHLAPYSPEKRCGKTTLLDALHPVCPNARYTTNISPAALYRVIEQSKPTLLMDESQSLSRRGSEASEVLREILNAGIGKNARVIRCGGKNNDEIREFSTYSPKVFAMIGEPDAVLADRSLPVPMRRKTRQEKVRRFWSREVETRGEEIREALSAWATARRDAVKEAYAKVEPFAVENDRMADLLTPLMAVLAVEAPARLADLEAYARALDERDAEMDTQSDGVQLLADIRAVFDRRPKDQFLQTISLLSELTSNFPKWAKYNRGEPITDERIARLLRPYGVKPFKNQKVTGHPRGYSRFDFEKTWACYLPTPTAPEKPG